MPNPDVTAPPHRAEEALQRHDIALSRPSDGKELLRYPARDNRVFILLRNGSPPKNKKELKLVLEPESTVVIRALITEWEKDPDRNLFQASFKATHIATMHNAVAIVVERENGIQASRCYDISRRHGGITPQQCGLSTNSSISKWAVENKIVTARKALSEEFVNRFMDVYETDREDARICLEMDLPIRKTDSAGLVKIKASILYGLADRLTRPASTRMRQLQAPAVTTANSAVSSSTPLSSTTTSQVSSSVHFHGNYLGPAFSASAVVPRFPQGPLAPYSRTALPPFSALDPLPESPPALTSAPNGNSNGKKRLRNSTGEVDNRVGGRLRDSIGASDAKAAAQPRDGDEQDLARLMLELQQPR